jgi:hypothetical protein
MEESYPVDYMQISQQSIDEMVISSSIMKDGIFFLNLNRY